MILHTLNASPASAAFRDCLAVLGGQDAVVLMGDGVYAALAQSAPLKALLESGAALYLLDADALLAGVTATGDTVRRIPMDGFVQLTEDYPRQQAWY